jgi:RNA polymerase sigma-70 factor (ECF subfamily)
MVTATESSDLGSTMQDDAPNALAALITLVQQDHPHASTELFRHLQPRFMAIAVSIFGNWNDAEDAVQESFVALFPKIDRIDIGQKPEAYCDVVCRNKCLTLIKRAARRRTREFESDRMELLATVAESPNHNFDPDWAVQVWNEVLDLTEDKTREIIHLRFVDDLTFGEIASQIGMSIGGVHKRLQRLLYQMRERFLEQD